MSNIFQRVELWVYISWSHNICPLKLFKNYLYRENSIINASECILRVILKDKKSRLRGEKKLISYITMDQNLIQVIKAVVLNWKDYGVHNLWEGVASVAAK